VLNNESQQILLIQVFVPDGSSKSGGKCG
jgi:hypothetical protein